MGQDLKYGRNSAVSSPLVTSHPKITVLMPVYNAESHLHEAIRSIIKQSFSDFEFLIINDGSTDRSVEIVRSYRDPRINLVHNEKNLGLIATLNRGIHISRGEYIARMDSDDISLPRRFETQVKAMDKHGDWGICGSWVRILGGPDSGTVQCYPTKSKYLLCELLFDSPIAHPSIMIRKETIFKSNEYYDENFKHAEDYDLWCRLAKITSMSNIPKILLNYRIHGSQTGSKHSAEQKSAANRIRFRQITQLDIDPSEEEFQTHKIISTLRHEKLSENFVDASEHWFMKLITANSKKKIFPEPEFSKTIGLRWLLICNLSTGGVGWKMKRYFDTPLKHVTCIDWSRLVKSYLMNRFPSRSSG